MRLLPFVLILLLVGAGVAQAAPAITQTVDKSTGPAGTVYVRTFRLIVPTTDAAPVPAGDFRYRLNPNETLTAMVGPGTEDIDNQAWLEFYVPPDPALHTLYSNIVSFLGVWWNGRPVTPLPVPDFTRTIGVPYTQVNPGEYREWALTLRWR